MTTEEKITEKIKTDRMHSIILKEKDKEGNWLSLDVDTILPIFPFGEGIPILMAIVDDRSYFIPLDQINWYEQNFGVKNDLEIAKTLAEEKYKKRNKMIDTSCS